MHDGDGELISPQIWLNMSHTWWVSSALQVVEVAGNGKRVVTVVVTVATLINRGREGSDDDEKR